MAYEDLLKSVEESAREKEQELRNRQTTAIDEIKALAKKQAAAVRQGQLDEAGKSVTAERNKQLYLTKAENKENLIRVREAAFEQAFAGAEKRLASLRADPHYPAIFERLFREVAGSFGDGGFVVHVDPRDEALCRKILAGLNPAPGILADITTAGGVIAGTRDNTVVIRNTVESRLERARELKRREIHAILFAE